MANCECDTAYLYISIEKPLEKDYDVGSLGISIFSSRISHNLYLFEKISHYLYLFKKISHYLIKVRDLH
jgi:hypothetical protein